MMRASGFGCVAVALTITALPAWGQYEYVDGELLICPLPRHEVGLEARLAMLGLEILERDQYSMVTRVAVPLGSEAAWAAALNVEPGIAYAERNGIGSGGTFPTDTFLDLQWHLHNAGQSGGLPGADIGATLAWEILTGNAGVGVAVLDSGIQNNHPEFVRRIASNGWNFVHNTSTPEDDHGHGTRVSGTLAANADNNFGVAGIDWNCTVIPLKVLDANNLGTTFNLAQALNYAANQSNVDIISMSLINYPGNATLLNALAGARDAGKILIACAGNGGIGDADWSFPGASPLTISIGATTLLDHRASFSATGNALDFVAPGSDIVTTAFGTIDDHYNVASGCSFATPIAAGIASLLVARAQEYGLQLTHDDIYDLFLAGAADQIGPPGEDIAGWDASFGHGRLSAYDSIVALQPPNPADINADGVIDASDLVILLAEWGICSAEKPCPCDLSGDGTVDVTDLLILLAAWPS